MTGHFPFPHCPPGAADIMQEPHITELYLCFLGSLPSSRDFIGTVRAGTINQFASRPLGMKEPGGHWKVGMGPMNILRLKRTEGPLRFGLLGPTAFLPLTRAFQERSGLSLCGIGVSSRGLTEGAAYFYRPKKPTEHWIQKLCLFLFQVSLPFSLIFWTQMYTYALVAWGLSESPMGGWGGKTGIQTCWANLSGDTLWNVAEPTGIILTDIPWISRSKRQLLPYACHPCPSLQWAKKCDYTRGRDWPRSGGLNLTLYLCQDTEC